MEFEKISKSLFHQLDSKNSLLNFIEWTKSDGVGCEFGFLSGGIQGSVFVLKKQPRCAVKVIDLSTCGKLKISSTQKEMDVQIFLKNHSFEEIGRFVLRYEYCCIPSLDKKPAKESLGKEKYALFFMKRFHMDGECFLNLISGKVEPSDEREKTVSLLRGNDLGENVFFLLIHIATAVQMMGFQHNDLRLDNILISFDEETRKISSAVISDFGQSKVSRGVKNEKTGFGRFGGSNFMDVMSFQEKILKPFVVVDEIKDYLSWVVGILGIKDILQNLRKEREKYRLSKK